MVEVWVATAVADVVVWKVIAVWSDPISDMLTRIRNAVRVRRQYVQIPSSSLKVELKYGPRGENIINKLDRVSRPGRRVYSKVADLPRVLDGLGTMIVSTSQGVQGDRACREKKIGGELLCTVY